MARAATLAGAVALAGCSALPPGSPSQSGTLANAAVNAPGPGVKKARFNPFSDETEPRSGLREVIKNPTVAQVMQPGPLPEMSIGRADAPITIIKYASMTCPYCRRFHLNDFPALKRRYIDTGKVRFILREFPIGFQSGAATIALRCVDPSKYFKAYDVLMRQQAKWVSQEVRREPIWQVVRKLGISRAKFDACYDDKQLVEKLNVVKNRGRTLGVIGTPNYFINGRLYKRTLTMTDIDRIVANGGPEPRATASN